MNIHSIDFHLSKWLQLLLKTSIQENKSVDVISMLKTSTTITAAAANLMKFCDRKKSTTQKNTIQLIDKQQLSIWILVDMECGMHTKTKQISVVVVAVHQIHFGWPNPKQKKKSIATATTPEINTRRNESCVMVGMLQWEMLTQQIWCKSTFIIAWLVIFNGCFCFVCLFICLFLSACKIYSLFLVHGDVEFCTRELYD